VLVLCPLGEYDTNNDRSPSADPENNCQRSWEEEFCVYKSHYESESDQTERNSESSPIGLHEVRVGIFYQFTPSFLPSFKPPLHVGYSIADGKVGAFYIACTRLIPEVDRSQAWYLKTRLNYRWRRERRKAQKLLNRSEKKLQVKNTPQGCLKDQPGRAVKVGCRCRIFEYSSAFSKDQHLMEEVNEPRESQENRIDMLGISCRDERGVASASGGRQNVYEYGAA
jgi:hypothetical protein